MTVIQMIRFHDDDGNDRDDDDDVVPDFDLR